MSSGRATGINRETVQPWLPFVFCAFLSSMAIAGPLVALTHGPMSTDWWVPVFAGSLPMCFFFAGSAMWQMRKEIAALRLRVAVLEASAGVAAVAAPSGDDTNSSPPRQFSLKFLLAVVAVLGVQFAIFAKLFDAIDGVVKTPLVAPRARAKVPPAHAPPARRVRRVPPAPSAPTPDPRLPTAT